jgi:hypothetical protein
MQRLLLFIVLLVCPHLLPAQSRSYPQGYFRNPLNIPILLAGNFGECRPGHFHSGMDIKTGGHENEPVFAAADGYVSRIKMEPGGFGHGLYITHPNGYTTLYAHLNDFTPAIQRYVRQQQYARESWTVDLQLPPKQFPVKKGQQIAWSGNTGGSTAPHLHFEIRDTETEHPLNPQLFGFNVKDNRAPVLKQLVVYDMTVGIYDVAPKFYPLSKKGSAFISAEDSITISSAVSGIGLVVDDYMPGSDNTLAIYTMEWYLDGILQGRVRLDDIGYDETRYINAFADYGLKKAGKPWVQCLFQLPGNRLSHIYASLNAARGLLRPGDEDYHQVRILVKDVAGNSSEMSFHLRCTEAPHAMFHCTEPAEAGKLNRYTTENVQFFLDEKALYDVTCIDISSTDAPGSLSSRIAIGRPTIPVHHSFDLSIKPSKLIPFALRGKIAMVYNDGSKAESGRAAMPAAQGGWYTASVRAFGEYRLVADTIGPLVKPVTKSEGNLSKARGIVFKATDETTSVKTFRAELDGKWLLFEQHEDEWKYVFDSHCPAGKHNLVVMASDENGNETMASYTFTR